MAKKRERVIVNVLWDEEGTEYFRIEKEGDPNQEPPDMFDSGVFLDTYAVDRVLEENKDELRLVKDYRD